MTYTHANPRFYIGPNTNELIVGLGRAYGTQLSDSVGDVTITFRRRHTHTNVVSTWVSYVVKNTLARFEIPESFRTQIDDYPTGFYDGVVTINECEIGRVELIKAPGHYLSNAQSVQDKCHGDNTWVEPNCVPDECPTTCACNCNGEPGKPCDCAYQVKNNCPTCYNEVHLAKINLIAEYAGLNEIQECSPDEGGE